MVNYQQGKVYKIESINSVDGDSDIYIGSTTKHYLSERMVWHRGGYVQWKKGNINYRKKKVSSFILFDKYGVQNCRIVLLETCPCNSVEELRAKEACYIRSMPNVNKNIPGRTKEMYREEHKEHLHQRELDYYQENKEFILKRKTTPTLCECGCTVSRCGTAKHIRTQKHISAMNELSAVLPDSNRDLR